MKTVLVVDDSGVVRKVARRMLEGWLFRVEEAENGESALARCDLAMPDGILLDWNMPVMTGPEFLAQLRRRADGARPKVVFCTTLNDVHHISQALAAGADEYIMKPFDEDILREKLVEVGLLDDIEQ
ncbi:response regulator [Prosthecomicrobium pneumaticum]|uniref:Two-component system chemotaxis response regulator CheY n=1 Tax=Prosthecomicrobium pneumaticum TaxID=81895 RepID=A0A7W9CT35_9HYPH|nr:response regulator [Prosthecomicrobium pneumaticum]MBB5751053.1 two-component system chemotaxis response regulator CheY [Prosthecomicrobium pneumaticum]